MPCVFIVLQYNEKSSMHRIFESNNNNREKMYSNNIHHHENNNFTTLDYHFTEGYHTTFLKIRFFSRQKNYKQ